MINMSTFGKGFIARPHKMQKRHNPANTLIAPLQLPRLVSRNEARGAKMNVPAPEPAHTTPVASALYLSK